MNAQKTLRRKELAATISLLLAAYSGAALAQDQDTAGAEADEDEGLVEEERLVMETVLVTGIRRSLQDSIATKMDESSIVEAVSAEEIGKLPDVSIAESLARLPGLTSQRLNGRGQVISVRGLSPDFTTALLNGRQQVSAGDNRGVEFDQYPSELLSQVVVYKSPDASLIGQGLAGTADMRTIRPLQYGERAIAANLRYEWNEKSALNAGAEDSGERFSFSYVDQFADDTIGIAVGLAHMSNPSQGERMESWDYPRVSQLSPYPYPDEDALVHGGTNFWARSSLLERDGIIGILEYEPNDDFSMAIDVYYSEFEERQQLTGITFPTAWGAWDGDPSFLEPGFTVENGLVTQSTFSGVKAAIRGDENFRESELFAAGLNFQFSVGDDWEGRFDLSHSEIDRVDNILETTIGTGPNGSGLTDTITITEVPGGFRQLGVGIDYSDPNLFVLTSPKGWGANVPPPGQMGFYKGPTIKDELQQADLSFKKFMDAGAISNVELGVNFTTREKSNDPRENAIVLRDLAPELAIPTEALLGNTDLSFGGVGEILTIDPNYLLAQGILQFWEYPHTDIVFKQWQVEEDVLTAYAQFGLDTQVGDYPLTGNFGFQYVDNDQSSNAFASAGDGVNLVAVPFSDGKSYSEILPSLNLTLELDDSSFLRFAAARTLARPRMDQMKASLRFNYDPSLADSPDINRSPWGGDSGNTQLDPWIADGYDLSYEKYFEGGTGYLAIAYFYKDLKTYIYNQTRVADFSGIPVSGPEPVLREGLVSQPVNGNGGRISGWEFSLSLDGTMLADALEGFGAIFNVSFTDSSVQPDPGNPARPIEGLSDKIANLTLYYENEKFSARVNSRYRDEFLGEIAGFGNARNFRLIEAENIVDAQLSYNFTVGEADHAMTAYLQGNNLTDEPLSSFYNFDDRQINWYQEYGRSYMVGLSFKY